MVPLVLGGAIAGGVTYQVYNPPEKQAPEGRGSMPRNLQDWRLTPQDAKLRIPNYWRNHARPASEPIEDAYRSTYNNIYTNGPKLMRDAITGNLRIITPDGNSTNDSTITTQCFIANATQRSLIILVSDRRSLARGSHFAVHATSGRERCRQSSSAELLHVSRECVVQVLESHKQCLLFLLLVVEFL